MRTVRVKVYNRLSTRDWEETFALRIFELLWSNNIPEEQAEIKRLLDDLSLLSRAKRIQITRQDPQVVALVMKNRGEYPFMLDPEAYRAGLPGQGRVNTQLVLEEHVLVVNIRHANDPKGRIYCFRLTNTGIRLEQFNVTPLPIREARDFLRMAKPTLE